MEARRTLFMFTRMISVTTVSQYHVCVGGGNIYTAHRTIRYRYFLPVSLSHVCLLSVVLLALRAVGNSGLRDRFSQQNEITRQHSDVSETNLHPIA